jgi:hypothetical protein
MELKKLNEKEIVYGIPVERDKLPKLTKRLPQYDDCLKAFVSSGVDLWKVNIDALPSKDIRVVLSSLKWRIKHREEFKDIQVFMRINNIYLEKTKEK